MVPLSSSIRLDISTRVTVFEVGGEDQFLSTFVNPSAKKADDPVAQFIRDRDPRITREERQRYEYLSTRDRFVKQHLKRLQPVAMSFAAFPLARPTSQVYRCRESWCGANTIIPGDVVEPGYLSAITGNQDPASIRLDPFKRWPTRSRRMTLAQWIASPNNPMTARVMVNRLWHWHFGQGIVRTPSDFGYLSGGPSHQQLLDWLAEQFIKEKWSVKAIHRLILNSATYRQSSARHDPRASEVDPDNRLLWQFPRRRLDAEAIRDSVLSVSGRFEPRAVWLADFPSVARRCGRGGEVLRVEVGYTAWPGRAKTQHLHLSAANAHDALDADVRFAGM